MSDPTSENQVTDTAGNTESQANSSKMYTQEEFDRHMAGLKNSLSKKYERMYSELGDPEELRELKTQAEQRKLEEAKKRGEFDRVIQELAAKKDAEIQKRDQIIREYKVNTPLISAAARFRAVAPEQVKSLLNDRVRMNESGDVEVLDEQGSVRYSDAGTPLAVEDLVREFLDSNPHFVQATPATTNTRSQVSAASNGRVDVTKLDLRRPEHRKMYKEARAKGQI